MSNPNEQFRWSPRARRVWLTIHIAASVSLLGDLLGFMAVAIRGTTTDNPAIAEGCWNVLQMFGFAFGIPLSLISIATGVALGLGSKWGVFRYPWVTMKLGLNLSVLAVGAVVLGPAIDAMLTGGGGTEWRLIAGAGYDIVALTTAVALSVFKPGRPRTQRMSASTRSAPRPTSS